MGGGIASGDCLISKITITQWFCNSLCDFERFYCRGARGLHGAERTSWEGDHPPKLDTL